MAKTLTDIHNQGQNDRSEGNGYNPPHGLGEDLFTWTEAGCRKIAEENGAYRKGWENADEQAK
jgi:hypothetical protein